jgi:ketosteroid isomerase-like protein
MLNLMERDNVAAVRRLWDAFAEGGLDAVLDIVDPDVEWSLFGTGGEVVRGHHGLREYMTDVAARGDEIDASVYEYEALDDDHVLVSGHVRFRSATGMSDTQLHWLYRFRQGRLVRFQAYQTRAESLEAARSED